MQGNLITASPPIDNGKNNYTTDQPPVITLDKNKALERLYSLLIIAIQKKP